jgi:hypothetical protein
LLRCVLSCTEIVVLSVIGIGASAATSGAQTDLATASHGLPHALLAVASPLALLALLILPVGIAVQLLVRRQLRRLGEAVATGVLAAAVTAAVNELLTRPAASRLYYAIIMARPGTSHAAALDPYLAGLVAFATMVGLAGLPYWRNALWTAIAGYAIVHVAARHTSVLTLLITVLAGRAIGLAVRYVAGSASQRPGAREIAGALGAAGLPVQIHLDVAQLLAELALLVGTDRAAGLALANMSSDDLVAAVPGREVAPARLKRIRPRTLLTLIAAAAAVYLLAGELARASLSSVLHAAD